MFNICRNCCNKCNCKACSNCYCSRCNCCKKCCVQDNWQCECYNRECCSRGMDKYEVTMEQLKQMQIQGAIICDIRSPQEYNEGHLPGAVLLPEYDIYRNAQKMFPNKAQEIILYCGTGSRSYSSLIKFQKLGYTNVYNLYKGTENY